MSVDQLTTRPSTRVVRVLDGLWRAVASPRALYFLLVWLSCVVGLSLIVPQSPHGIEDPLVRSQWLANLPREMWLPVERMEPLGVFRLFTSVWLRLPLSLLLAHALVVLAARTPSIWQRIVDPGGSLTRPWEETHLLGKSFRREGPCPETSAELCQLISGRLVSTGHCVLVDPGAHSLVAWRGRWGWLAPVSIYAGLVLLAMGLMLQSWLGQVHELNLQPGSAVAVPGRTSSSLVLDGTAAAGGDPAAADMSRVAVGVVTDKGGGQSFSLNLGHSDLVQGMWLTILDVQSVVEVTAVDAQTEAHVLLQPFVAQVTPKQRVRLTLTEDPETHFAGVPSRNVTLRVDHPTGDNRLPLPLPLAVSFFRGVEATPSFVATLAEGGETTFDGVRYRTVLSHDARVRIHVGLWWGLAAAGWATVGVGCCLLAAGRPVWVRVQLMSAVRGCRALALVDAPADDSEAGKQMRELIVSDHDA